MNQPPTLSLKRLSGQHVLHLWETGASLHPLDRALRILTFACPQTSWKTLATLSLGRRDALLLRLYHLHAGDRMEGQADCPRCGECVELVLQVSEILVAEPADDTAQSSCQIEIDDFLIDCRLPDSRDLADAIRCSDLTDARRRLVERCVIRVQQRDGGSLETTLPESILTAMGDWFDQQDPLADLRLRTACPDCGHRWTVGLDVVQFLWWEISRQAGRLLCDVHRLASAYGWAERDILNMPAARRNAYLQQI